MMPQKFEFPKPPQFPLGTRVQEFPQLPEFPLPPRGIGLLTGRAGARRGGMPRTEIERRAQRLVPLSNSNPGLNIESLLPAPPPNLPLPRFLLNQMKR